tara:strand:- start:237 stop:506 length:270 start_codon:yes stop_codon:yes gene_type:complete
MIPRDREEWTLWGGFLWVCFLLGIVISTGCCVVQKSFLSGEEAAYGAIAGEYVAYVASDTSLTADQADVRKRTIRAWRFSLDKAAEVSK